MAKKKSKKPSKTKKVHKVVRAKKVKRVKKMTPITITVRSAATTVVKNQRLAAAAPLPSDQVDKFREILSQKRDDLMEVVQRKKEEEIEDIGVGDEADIATHSVEKEMLFELTDSEKQTLDMVEAALLKLDRGVYGACESCQKAIPRMRLQLMPWARYCVNCKAEQEVPASE